MRDTAGSVAAPTARRKNVRRKTFLRGGDILSLLLSAAHIRFSKVARMERSDIRGSHPRMKPYFASPFDTATDSPPRISLRSIRATLPSIRHQSIPKHPADDTGIALISAVLGKRLLVPELVRRRAVRKLEQQRGADVVGAVGRADRSAKDEAVAVRREVRLVRVEVLAEELRRAGLGSRAQELLHTLAAIVGLALLEAVRPAVNFDALVEAGLAHGLARDECVRRRAVVELHEKRRAQRVAPVVGDAMAVADY